MANTVVMKVPTGVGQVVATGPLTSGQTYTPDTSGVIIVDPRDELALIQGGCSLASPAGSISTIRNLLDGGDFSTNPWQRGTSFTSIANTLTYTADRWFAVGGSSSNISVSQVAVTAVPGFSGALQFGRASANSNTAVIKFGQACSTFNSVKYQGLQVCLSFWALAGANWSPASGNLNVFLASGTGTDGSAANLGSGGWTGYTSLSLTPNQGSAAPASGIAQPITTTWTRYSFYGTIPAGANQIGVLFEATPVGTAGANDWVQIIGVQLESGTQPSAFDHRTAADELIACQRYAYQINEPGSGVVVGVGAAAGTNAELVMIPLPVQMRVAPTVTVTAGSFKFLPGTSTATAVSGFAASATHTANYISLVGTTTATSGVAVALVGGGGSGTILASADY
jgi:hypothetical protein